MPKVCMSMAVYNGLEWLKNVSIPSILNQTFTDWKLFVIFDGMTDENLESIYWLSSLADSRIFFGTAARVLPDPPFTIGSGYWNIAGFQAVNNGLELILFEKDCEYIGHLDQDDYWKPDHLETLIDKIEETGADLVYGNTAYFQNNTRTGNLSHYLNDKQSLKQANMVAHSSILYKKSAPHEYFYSGVPNIPSDYRHLLSFTGELGYSQKTTVFYFQRCSIDFAKKVIEENETNSTN